MSYQTAGNVLVAIRAETTTGVACTTVTGATQLRITDSPGLKLNRAVVQSEENRADGLRTMGRLGYKTIDGSYNAELSAGGATDILIEALMRSTWATNVAISFLSMTTVAVATNEIVAAASDWIATEGVRVGDVFRLTGTDVVTNNDINLRVTAVSSATINVPAGSLTTLAAAATGTLTILRKLISAATPTRRSFNVEQYDKDTDLSELFLGCRVVGFNLSCKPGQMATVQYTLLGMDRTALATGTSPYFTSPSLTTGLGMIADDSAIYVDGVAVTDFNGFDLTFTLAAAGEPVIGSLTTPDIFDNDLTVSGTISGLREDFTYIGYYDAEQEFELSILLEEEETAPKACLGIYLPRVKIQALDAPFGGGDGAKVETRELMIGPQPAVAATGHDATIAAFHTSELAS